MAAGEYVCVSSQADIQQANIVREREERATDDSSEGQELVAICIKRGLDAALAKEVVD